MATLKRPSYWFMDYRKLFGTIDHKQIGMLYMVFAAVNLTVAGYYALLIRTELFNVGLDGFISPANYGSIFTMHGTAMIFLVIMPMGAGFGNYLIPLMIGAKDLYWPRWNNIAFWMLIPGASFVWMSEAPIGWTAYPPLSTTVDSTNLWIIGLIIVGTSSIIGAINFFLTIFNLRKPGLGMMDLDLFSWAILFTSFIQLFATPIITTALVMLLFERIAGAPFFTITYGSSSLLWQHIFWSYSHPAVYIMILPAMGIISVIIGRFSQNHIFGKSSMIYSMGAITLLGFMVWGHHNFTASPNAVPNWFFTFTTFLIAIPSGIKTFNWILTMYKGSIHFEPPLLFALSFILGFILGGFSGVIINTIPLDYYFHDTYFVVGHFHFIIIGGGLSAIIGGIYFIFPDATGRMYNKKAAYVHWAIWTVAFIVTFGGMNVLGYLNQPRRYVDYSVLSNYAELEFWHRVTTIGAYLQALAFLIGFSNLFYSAIKGPKVGDKPYSIENPQFWPLETKEESSQ